MFYALHILEAINYSFNILKMMADNSLRFFCIPGVLLDSMSITSSK